MHEILDSPEIDPRVTIELINQTRNETDFYDSGFEGGFRLEVGRVFSMSDAFRVLLQDSNVIFNGKLAEGASESEAREVQLIGAMGLSFELGLLVGKKLLALPSGMVN